MSLQLACSPCPSRGSLCFAGCAEEFLPVFWRSALVVDVRRTDFPTLRRSGFAGRVREMKQPGFIYFQKDNLEYGAQCPDGDEYFKF
jgi:hypothetical protein